MVGAESHNFRDFFFKWTNISYYFEYYYLLVKRCTTFSCILRLCTGCCEDVITKNSWITKTGARNLDHKFQKLFWFRLLLTLIWLLFYLVLCIQLSLTSDYFPVNIKFPYFENTTSRHRLCTSKQIHQINFQKSPNGVKYRITTMSNLH